jgi:broad specificity phosphatase PhoE
VWPRDLVSATHGYRGTETVDAVAARVRSLILELEARHEGECLVLASHADTLQIAQCYIAGVDARTFSMYRFANGEVRELLPNAAWSLPSPVPLSYNADAGTWVA